MNNLVQVIENKKNIEKNSKKRKVINENIKFFKENELKRLLVGIESESEYHILVFQLMFETGARVEELRQARYFDIDFDHNRITIKTLKQKHNDSQRVLALSDNMIKKLLNYRLKNDLSENDFVFAKKSERNAPVRQSLNKMLKKFVKMFLGETNYYLEKAHNHCFRHTRAINLLDSGVNIRIVQKFLGHSNFMNTLIYLNYSNKEVNEAVEKANFALGLK